MINYKDKLKRLTKKQLIDSMEVSQSLVERAEAELAGAQHQTDINGPDGIFADGRHLEIKTQKYIGNFTLRGRGKYGSPSLSLHSAKSATNDHIVVTGYDEGGEVYYRFSFQFAAIADRYLEAVHNGLTNYDFIPPHYANHPTFIVEYIADLDTLQENKHKFQPKFYNFLLSH